MTPPLVIERPKLRLRSGNGWAIIGAASAAAGKGGWSHQDWLNFRRSLKGLGWEEMFSTVCSRFAVECAPSFSADPINWRVEHFNPQDDEGTDE